MENKKPESFLEIDVTRLLGALWRKIWAIILAAVIGAGAFFTYASMMITPTYRAQALMYVNNRNITLSTSSVNISTGEISAASALVNTYTVILKSRNTLNEVIREANLKYSYERLKGMITAASVNETQIFSITVTSTDPEEAALIANTVAKVLPDKIAEIVDGSSVRVVDYAVTPTGKVAPKLSKYAVEGAFIGALLVCAVVIVVELLDDAIHSEDYITQTYGIPSLAVIPDLDAALNEKGKYYNYYYYDYFSAGKVKDKEVAD